MDDLAFFLVVVVEDWRIGGYMQRQFWDEYLYFDMNHLPFFSSASLLPPTKSIVTAFPYISYLHPFLIYSIDRLKFLPNLSP